MTDQHKDIIINSFVESFEHKENRAEFLVRIYTKLLQANQEYGE